MLEFHDFHAYPRPSTRPPARRNTHAAEVAQSRSVPKWLSLDEEGTSGKVVALPAREDLELSFQEQLIVELYSK